MNTQEIYETIEAYLAGEMTDTEHLSPNRNKVSQRCLAKRTIGAE